MPLGNIITSAHLDWSVSPSESVVSLAANSEQFQISFAWNGATVARKNLAQKTRAIQKWRTC